MLRCLPSAQSSPKYISTSSTNEKDRTSLSFSGLPANRLLRSGRVRFGFSGVRLGSLVMHLVLMLLRLHDLGICFRSSLRIGLVCVCFCCRSRRCAGSCRSGRCRRCCALCECSRCKQCGDQGSKQFVHKNFSVFPYPPRNPRGLTKKRLVFVRS